MDLPMEHCREVTCWLKVIVNENILGQSLEISVNCLPKSITIKCMSLAIKHLTPLNTVSSVLSHPLWPHGLQHARPSCPSPTSRAYSNSCSLSRWCHPTISSSAACLQSFPASGSFQMSWLFTSGGQSIGVSAPALVLPMNIKDWLPLGWTGWISLLSKGLSRVFSNTTVQILNIVKLGKYLKKIVSGVKKHCSHRAVFLTLNSEIELLQAWRWGGGWLNNLMNIKSIHF